MWQVQTESEAEGRVVKIFISDSGVRLRFSDFLKLLVHSAGFRTFLTSLLADMPFRAFRWETPAVTTTTLEQEFECVVLDSPGLVRTPVATSFADYFKSHSTNEVAVFPNLGKDAILVVPCPLSVDSDYCHLASFLRNSPDSQQQAYWKAVGNAMLRRISLSPVWLNTAGAGVPWLHVRLDSQPKYYSYSRYKRFDANAQSTNL